MNRSHLSILSLLLVATCTVQAQEKKESMDTTLLDLLELLDTKVTVASKKAERTSDAAASITSFTAQFIEQTGSYTLGDLAQLTPGYSTYSIYGEQVFETRGQKAGSFNNNLHLLLVDGIPVNHTRNYKAFTQEDLPLQFAERVEFLRGPASSLYGVSAFYGVVSITPKGAPEGTQVETLMGGGNDARSKRVMTTITNGSAASETVLSFSYYNKGDSLAYVGTTDDPANLYRDGRTAMFMRASHKIKDGAFEGLTVGTFLNYKNGDLGELWNEGAYTSPVDQITWSTFIPYLKYEHALSDTVKFDGYIKYNESDEKGGASPFSAASAAGYNGTGTVYSVYDIRVADYEALAEFQWSPRSDLDVIAGVNYDTRWQKGSGDGGYNINIKADGTTPYDGVPVNRTGDYKTLSTFVQAHLQLDVLAGLNIVGGLRMDKGDAPGNSYSQLSPRFSLVQKITDGFNLKAMYGTALYAPGIKEVELNNEKKTIDPSLVLASLKAEKFNTTEFAATYTGHYLSGSATYFTNKTVDALATFANLNNSYQNTPGNTKADGFELELRAALRSGWKGWANYSSAKAEDPNGRELSAVPTATGSAGVTYTVPSAVPLECSFLARYMGDFRVSDPTLPRPSGGTFLDARLGLVPVHKLGMSIELRNMANKAMKYPAGNLPNVPLPGRTAMFNLWMRF
jgi:outer membrane receptor protein involved in Fe transport